MLHLVVEAFDGFLRLARSLLKIAVPRHGLEHVASDQDVVRDLPVAHIPVVHLVGQGPVQYAQMIPQRVPHALELLPDGAMLPFPAETTLGIGSLAQSLVVTIQLVLLILSGLARVQVALVEKLLRKAGAGMGVAMTMPMATRTVMGIVRSWAWSWPGLRWTELGLARTNLRG